MTEKQEPAQRETVPADPLIDKMVAEIGTDTFPDSNVRGFVLQTGQEVFPEAFSGVPHNRLTPKGRDQIVAAVKHRRAEFGGKYDLVMNQLQGFRLQPSEYDR